jgi:uncharacterized protein (TIGR03435 family)
MQTRAQNTPRMRSVRHPLSRFATFALLWLATVFYAAAQARPTPAAPPSQSGGAAVKELAFDIVTIRAADPKAVGWGMQYPVDGFTMTNVPVRRMLQEAYDKYEAGAIAGGPKWIDSTKFDLRAKIDSTDVARMRELTLSQRRHMLQVVLAKRFGLVVHIESTERSVYELVVARGGPKMHETRPEDMPPGLIKGMGGLHSGRSEYNDKVQGDTMFFLAQTLTSHVGRHVIDKTGLTGRYDYTLRWSPNVSSEPAPAPGSTAHDDIGPDIFTAVQEQLGLKLQPANGAMDVLLIDHIDLPSEN